jgi:uncharacterized membrane protein YbhN (UPF0104 family)
MPRKYWRWLGTALGAAVLLLVLQRLYLGRQQLQLSWRDVSWPLVAASFGLFLLAQSLFAFSWHRLLAEHGGAGSLRGDFARWCVTLAGKYVPGKVWQGVARLGLYHRSHGKFVVATAFAREMLLSVSAALALVALHGLLDSRAPQMTVPALVVALLLLFLATPPVVRVLAGWLARSGRFSVEGRVGSRFGWLLVWIFQLAGYALLGLGFVVLSKAMLASGPMLVLPGIAALCFAGVAGIAAFFVPAGLGVREAALAWYLSPFIGLGPAAMLAIAARVWLTFGELCLIALGLWLVQREVEP